MGIGAHTRREAETAALAELQNDFPGWTIVSTFGGYRAVEKPARCFTAMETGDLRVKLAAAEASRPPDSGAATVQAARNLLTGYDQGIIGGDPVDLHWPVTAGTLAGCVRSLLRLF